MSKTVKLELSAADENGSIFSFSRSFEGAALPPVVMERIYEEAVERVRASMITSPVASITFPGVRAKEEASVEHNQAQMESIRANPGDALMQIRRLKNDREQLQERLGKAIEKLQRMGISQQKIEDLYTRTKTRGLAPFAVDLDLQQADLQIEKMHRAITEGMEREDKLQREVLELRARLMEAGLASEDEITEWKKQG